MLGGREDFWSGVTEVRPWFTVLTAGRIATGWVGSGGDGWWWWVHIESELTPEWQEI